MRNMVIGVVLAVTLLAALFVAARFATHPAQKTSDATSSVDSEQAATQIKDDFIGNKAIGSWRLSCGKGMELPKSPSIGGREASNSQTPPKGEPFPQHWKIPRCRVFVGLRNPAVPTEEVRVTFRQVGVKRALAIFLRFPPSEVSPGDQATLRVDQTDRPMPIRTCAATFCLSIESIRHVEEPPIVNAKKLTLIFTPRTAGKAVAVKLPTDGLAQAIGIMRRIDR